MYFQNLTAYEDSLSADQKFQIKKNKGGITLKDEKANAGRPKRPPSAFIFFSMSEQKNQPGSKPTEIIKHNKDIWNNMSDADKRPYLEKADALRRTYAYVHALFCRQILIK